MVGGARLQLSTNYLVISLAAAFVLYHVWQSILGPINFVSAYLPTTTNVMVQHDAQPTPAANSNRAIAIGLNAAANQWPTSVSIPAVNINLKLEGSMEKSGSWVISETGANFALNSALPNPTAGNTVLFGHDRPHLFRAIHNLKPGDSILVHDTRGTYKYTMTGHSVVSPTDISVMDQTETSTLTLLTCDGWASQDRYVVTADFASFTPAKVQ